MRIVQAGRSLVFDVFMDQRRIYVWSGGDEGEFAFAEPAGAEPAHAAAEGALSTPLPGTVVALEVQLGEKVSARQTLIVIEAMKMEHAIRAPRDGTVTAIHFKVGERVAEGVTLIELGP